MVYRDHCSEERRYFTVGVCFVLLSSKVDTRLLRSLLLGHLKDIYQLKGTTGLEDGNRGQLRGSGQSHADRLNECNSVFLKTHKKIMITGTTSTCRRRF